MKTWIKHHCLELVIILFALLVRLTFSLVIHPIGNYIFSDMNSYLAISNRLLLPGQSLSNVFYPIGYPLFLMHIARVLPNLFFPTIAILQSLMGVASVVLLYLISGKVLTKKFRLIFLIILAGYYPWIDFGGYLMSETLATLLLTLMVYVAFYFFDHKNLLWLFSLPLLIGLATLVRANLLLPGIFIVCWFGIQTFFTRGNFNRRQIIRRLCVLLCGTVLAYLISFQIYRVYGGINRPMALNGGFVFMEGQCLYRGATDSNGWSFGPPVFTQRGLQIEKTFYQPFTNSGYFYRQGINCLLVNPRRVVGKLTELYYLFIDNVAWPSSDQPGYGSAMRVSHVLFNFTTLPGLFLATYLFYKNGRKLLTTGPAVLALIALSLAATTIIYYGDIRYRLPFDGILIMLSLWSYQHLTISREVRLLRE